MINSFKNLLNFCKKSHYNWNEASGLFSFSTKTSVSPSPNTLFKRILPAGDPQVSIVPILDQWVREGRPVHRSELKTIFKILRKNRRYTHALQLSKWIVDSSNLSPEDVAVRLDLISKVHGLREAENYFFNVPDSLKTFKVYGSLLNCYAKKKLVEQAEAIMRVMGRFGCNMKLSYCIMLNLYSKLGKREKLEKLVRQMEQEGITFDKPAYCILLNAYALNSDIEAMEKLLKKMEDDLLVNVNWNACVTAAKGYLGANLQDKASDMLKKAEKLIRGSNRGLAYQILLSMYASLGDKDEVTRIWHLYKKRGNMTNNGYFHMISSLIWLDDIDEAEKIFQEWESVNTSYDFRIPNTLINAYTKKGLLQRAEEFINRAINCGRKIPASTWDYLATGYYKDNQMEKAVDAMKNAIFSWKGTSWTLNRTTLTACLEYLREKGDAEKEKFERLLADQGIVLEQVSRLHESRSPRTGIFFELDENDEEMDSSFSGSD
ncbi:pentatricopeptide repeat-containing protein At2g20710, mitochondrial [Coffea arabica]|uniref:Pentatricopeptide repeat-containing protein At2g20710, mitochondrial n=1 Tax=Coffea arabica TaxID=13443 RepID=A0A6P6XK36_COFAR|nr:pentatricopeptide repeat-containing protein At2g20710, mitochondrial-like [Coffea arabica]